MDNEDRDSHAIERCRRGDTEAFEELVDRYHRPVFNAVYRMVGDYEETSDLTQQIFLKAWMNLAKFDDKRRFFSWLYRIAMNETINFIKNRKRFEDLDPKLRSTRPDPEEQLEAAEIADKVTKALASLSIDNRVVVILRHFLHFSYDQAAEILAIPEKTVKSRLFTARKQLREILIEEGLARGGA